MVEDRVNDGERIAQLFASELTGLETDPLADVQVVDADAEVTPAADGADAYGIAFRDERVGTVAVYPDCARFRLAVSPEAVEVGDTPITVESADDGIVLSIESGAAVKGAVDIVRTGLAARD